MSVTTPYASECVGDASALRRVRDRASVAFAPLFAMLDEQHPRTETGRAALGAFRRELRMHLRWLEGVADGLNDAAGGSGR